MKTSRALSHLPGDQVDGPLIPFFKQNKTEQKKSFSVSIVSKCSTVDDLHDSCKIFF